jgi:hypothetical protein
VMIPSPSPEALLQRPTKPKSSSRSYLAYPDPTFAPSVISRARDPLSLGCTNVFKHHSKRPRATALSLTHTHLTELWP